MKKKSIHVYLSQKEYDFLVKASQYYNTSLSKSLLRMADLQERMKELAKEDSNTTPDGAPIKVDSFSKYEF